MDPVPTLQEIILKSTPEQRKPISYLIYYVSKMTQRCCLCVFKSVMKEVIFMAHSQGSHLEFARAYETVTANQYIYGFVKKLRQFLNHYLKCQTF